jgi:hypothetical protein
LAGQPDREHRLTEPGRADQQHVRRGRRVAAACQVGDQLWVDAGLGVVVEVRQGGWRG